MQLRIGQGIDAHTFEEGRKLFLGGIEIPHSHGLKGHSDADALLHAICDAFLGALSLGDLGTHFSDKDPQWKGKSSLFFLSRINQLRKEKGWSIANIDSTIVTEAPMLRPYIDPMREKISSALEISLDQVSVKATRPEKMGALGRSEGLLAVSMVLLSK